MRQEERRAQTSQRLLEAAAVVFDELGFHAATVDDVAAAAGFTKGAVYANFGGKDALFLALLDRHVDDQLDAVDQLLGAEPGHDLVSGLRDASTATGSGSFGRLMLEFWQYAARNDDARAALADRYDTLRTRVAQAIRERDEELGSSRPGPPEQVATLVLAVDAGLFLQGMLDPPSVPAGLRATAISDLIDPPAPTRSHTGRKKG